MTHSSLLGVGYCLFEAAINTPNTHSHLRRYLSLSGNYAEDKVVFCEVEMNDKSRKWLIEGLGIETLPFAHIVHPEAGLVEELRIAKTRFKNLETALSSYVNKSCRTDNAEGTVLKDLFEEMEAKRKEKMSKESKKNDNKTGMVHYEGGSSNNQQETSGRVVDNSGNGGDDDPLERQIYG